MKDEKILIEMESLFLALADKTRLRLLNLMRESEICVGFLVDVLGESQPKISRHLAYLRGAGVVDSRRDGKWIYYKIIKPESDFAAELLRNTLNWMASEDKMRGEYEKLVQVCSSSSETITISLDFQPDTFAKANMNKYKKEELEIYLL